MLESLQTNLADPFWRLNNLYCCKREGTGAAVPFRLRDEQAIVLRHLYEHPLVPVYIVKSRRKGLSTGIGIGQADFATWNAGSVTRLIERTMDEAASKMRDIMRFAFLSMPRELRENFHVKHKDSPQLLDPLAIGMREEARSKMLAGVSARGGDTSWLWVSEWGPISYTDPARSREIRTGALPAARLGRQVTETTWMGGKHGDLWELIAPIMAGDPDANGKLFFFPWHTDPEAIRLDSGAIAAKDEDYFRELSAKCAKAFSHEQKRWFVVTRKTQGIFMKREYPSTLDEAFSAPVEGAIYAKELDVATAEGRIGHWPVDPSKLVHTAWDLGSPANMVVWYFQITGPMVRFVDVDFNLELNTAERVAHMARKPFAALLGGKHLMPHDASSANATGENVVQAYSGAGLKGIRVLARTHDIWVGINAVKELFPLMQFDKERCGPALEMLQTYHTRQEGRGGTLIDEPVHDRSSHFADALRYSGEAIRAGILKFTYGPGLDPSNVKPFDKPRSVYDPRALQAPRVVGSAMRRKY